MKKFAIIAALFMLIFASGIENAYSQNAPSISVSVNKKTFSPGESGVLTLTFKTGSKIKIPKDPGVTLELSTGEIEGNGFQDYSGGEGDYISNSRVKYNFTVPSGAASGSTIKISGSVRYGYCTVSDGVCKLANKDISATIRVK